MLLWFDGADFYTTSSIFPYEANNGVTIGTAFKRTGLNGFSFSGTNWIRKSLPYTLGASMVMGAAIAPTLFGISGVSAAFGFADLGIEQVGLYFNVNGQFFVGNNNVAVSPQMGGVAILNQFHYLELEVTFGGIGAGSANVYLDGAQVIGVSGIKTAFSGHNYANQAYFGRYTTGGGTAGMSFALDDVYVLDTTGPAPWNGPLGDSFVVTMMPSASGSFAQFTPSPAGTNLNWQRVAEIPADGATTYNQAAASGSRDSFVYPTWPPAGITLPNISQITAVMELEYGELDSAGSGSVQLIPRQAGTDNTAATIIPLGVGYAYGYSIFQLDVNGNLWLPSNLNATEFGYQRIT